MGRQQRAVRTRRVILEAAAAMFNDFGYDATTIGGLIERTRLTRGGLYFHFASKEQLARAILDETSALRPVPPQPLKLQEWVDMALLLGYRLPRDPLLGATVRLSVDLRARALFGTRWPQWTDAGEELLCAARDRGELLGHVEPAEVARLLTASWAGIRLLDEALPDGELCTQFAVFLELVLPNIACPGVLAKLDTSPHRAAALDRAT
ncbi:ScbR family autoregulator-binding transcription factor [Streptomyces lanatus]|uniref:ScbR family autoregulator-binding transcription factor n=1 Tax=Streptomyces lanatus TaxID=66900 RepID=A0ABV1XJ79_9ACTN|nr:ScbR family autoregulator-binding transcription factor [Streptomyces lanatus]GHG91380.1 gamma-butyrolactone-binding protein [Streptomyces lanatus]